MDLKETHLWNSLFHSELLEEEQPLSLESSSQLSKEAQFEEDCGVF